MKLLHFSLEIQTETSGEELRRKINEAFQINLSLYDGDMYDDEETWEFRLLGMWIKLSHFMEDNIRYLSAETNIETYGAMGEYLDIPYTNISEEILTLLKVYCPEEPWEISKLDDE
ncbi:hypothetical protein CBF23_002270 [Marinomonas agarivorans]|nr:hypothetical protein CBF23_002270 [Marinomonas agarivorans]